MVPCSKGMLTLSKDSVHSIQQRPRRWVAAWVTVRGVVLISLLSLFSGPADPGSLSATQRVGEQQVQALENARRPADRGPGHLLLQVAAKEHNEHGESCQRAGPVLCSRLHSRLLPCDTLRRIGESPGASGRGRHRGGDVPQVPEICERIGHLGWRAVHAGRSRERCLGGLGTRSYSGL